MLKRYFYFVKLFLLPYWWLFLAAILTGLIAAVASGIGVPGMIATVFPILFRADDAQVPTYLQAIVERFEHGRLVLIACLCIPFVFLVRGVATWGNAVLVNYLGIRILERLRMSVFSRLQQLPIGYLETHRKGDLLSRIVADTQGVQSMISQVSNDLIKQPITCIASTTAFLWLLFSQGEGWSFLANLAFIALAAWPIIVFGKRISRKSQQAQAGLGELNAIVQQNLETQREIRAYSMEKRQVEDFETVSDQYCNNFSKLVKYQRALVPIMETVTALALAFLLVKGKLGGMHLEDFLAIAAALFMCFDSMKRAGTAFNRFNEAQGALNRLAEILEEPDTIPDPAEPLPFEHIRGDISFRHVSFAYNKEKQVLRNINVDIPAGQIVGLVGPSGAGKTTFASLIARFYEVSEGAVLVDGIDLRNIRQKDLRAQLALVGQQALLFSGTIKENIALGKANASEEEICRAADAAAVSSFLEQQELGFDTQVGEGGTSLSGGQRQRVAIARAFVKNAPILILDEATASLDAKSEREIQEQLDSLAQGRTTLIVAHRFSTLRHAHRILVFDHGEIVGDGPHEQLYATCPLYKELYDRQGAES